MTRTIYKYKLERTDVQTIVLPRAYTILRIDRQYDDLCLWALGFPDSPSVPVIIYMIGTGHPVSEEVKAENYINTVFDGPFVFHFFKA